MNEPTFKVLVTDKVSDTGLAPLNADPRFEVIKIDDSSDPAFAAALPEIHGLVVRSATKVRSELLARAVNLRVVGRAGVGVDNIDLDAATERGVAVVNAPAGNTVSAAELTMALILSMVRQVAEADASVRGGVWARSRFKGVELRGRTLGLIGAGRIGGEVARRCHAFGMRVIAHDPYLSEARAASLRVERTSLEEVIESADVISLHVPLTDDTRGMISTATLSRMKKGAFLVNVARGGVVDEAALAQALHEGHLGGAALDVFANEPLEEGSPLRDAPNLVLTPHLGASTTEAQELVAIEIAETVRAALAEGDLSRALNAPAISGDTLRALGPIFDLGHRIGRLGCALAEGAVQGIEVRYAGASDEALRPLASYVLVGLLEKVLGDDRVNFVSSTHVAKQRGIGVSRALLARHTDYTEFVEVVIKAEGGELRLAGAMLGDSHSRIVRIADYHVDIVPEGTLIILKNHDVPGVIGRVGTLLGDHHMNIAEYHQARRSKGGEALAAIAVDDDVSPTVRSALLDLEEVSSAVVVRLGWEYLGRAVAPNPLRGKAMLSDLQTKKLTRYFEVYDVDDDGSIDAGDFERVIENVRILRGESDRSGAYVDLRVAYMGRWDALRASADIDKDGGVDIDEWLAYWQRVVDDDVRYAAEVTAITDSLFTVFDTDEDGSIGPDEFCNFYGVYGLPAALARSVFIELDSDSDGVISRAELLEIGAQFYRGNDPSPPRIYCSALSASEAGGLRVAP